MANKNNQQPDALIFDMDGTLWDAVQTYANGFNEFFKAHQISRNYTKEDLAKYMGWEQAKYLEATMPDFTVDEREKIYEEVIEQQYRLIQRDGGHLYEYVREGIIELSQKYKLFIVSNCPEFTIEYFMKWAKIEDYIIDSMAHGVNFKPKFENIRHLIQKHNLKNPFYVGDTDSDSLQSSKVPLPFVYVDYGFGNTNNYDLRFDSFKSLTEYFLSNKS